MNFHHHCFVPTNPIQLYQPFFSKLSTCLPFMASNHNGLGECKPAVMVSRAGT